MLDFLKEFSKENHDAIFFLPGDKENQVQIEAATYKEFGKKVGGSVMGDSYHVILFKERPETEELYDVDKFEAIFSDPFEYISGLIPQNWYGVIAKQTTTSQGFIQKVFDKLQQV